jgi:hypothetical protein
MEEHRPKKLLDQVRGQCLQPFARQGKLAKPDRIQRRRLLPPTRRSGGYLPAQPPGPVRHSHDFAFILPDPDSLQSGFI